MQQKIVIDYEKIQEIYGESILNDINDSIDEINANIQVMYKYNLYDIKEIFESYFLYFMQSEYEFEFKLIRLIKKLGNDYVEKIYSDTSYLEELL